MNEPQADFRSLFDTIHRKDPRPIYWYVLAPWIESHAHAREWLASFAAQRGKPIATADDDDLCRLYALSRVNETLLLGYQQGRADGTDWPGPVISLDDYVRFAEAFGLSVVDPSTFTPFHHEIVEVDQAPDDDAPVELVSTLWPCLMLGDMLFSRAGARISAGRRFVHKEVAESSMLYWAYRRKNRPHQDLSHGWGSNSQWRTRFRRDYSLGGAYHYNVDRKQDLAAPDAGVIDRDGLSRAERIELLTHRCFVVTTKPDSDLWPYDDLLRAAG
jgi:hypothetical protein